MIFIDAVLMELRGPYIMIVHDINNNVTIHVHFVGSAKEHDIIIYVVLNLYI